MLELIEQLKKEESRADAEGLTEEELEMYDLLVAGKKLSDNRKNLLYPNIREVIDCMIDHNRVQ